MSNVAFVPPGSVSLSTVTVYTPASSPVNPYAPSMSVVVVTGAPEPSKAISMSPRRSSSASRTPSSFASSHRMPTIPDAAGLSAASSGPGAAPDGRSPRAIHRVASAPKVSIANSTRVASRSGALLDLTAVIGCFSGYRVISSALRALFPPLAAKSSMLREALLNWWGHGRNPPPRRTGMCEGGRSWGHVDDRNHPQIRES